MKQRWPYFASIFVVILLIVVVDQYFDAMKAVNLIKEDSAVIKTVGWVLFALLILSGLLASNYVSSGKKGENAANWDSLSDWYLVAKMLMMVVIFCILLVAIISFNLGGWIFAYWSVHRGQIPS